MVSNIEWVLWLKTARAKQVCSCNTCYSITVETHSMSISHRISNPSPQVIHNIAFLSIPTSHESRTMTLVAIFFACIRTMHTRTCACSCTYLLQHGQLDPATNLHIYHVAHELAHKLARPSTLLVTYIDMCHFVPHGGVRGQQSF
jgi:hypothetical protein